MAFPVMVKEILSLRRFDVIGMDIDVWNSMRSPHFPFVFIR